MRLHRRLADGMRQRPVASASIAGGVALLVAAAATGIALSQSGTPSEPESGGPFVLPSLVATPTVPASTGAGPAPSPSLPASVATSVAQASSVQPLTADAAIAELWQAGPALDIDPNAHIRAVSAGEGAAIAAPPGTPATRDAVTVAAAFVNRYGAGFGLQAGQHTAVAQVQSGPGGHTIVRFQQQIGGVPVMGGDVTVVVDGDGRVITASGEAPAAAPTSTNASVSSAQASATALQVAADRTGTPAAELAVARAELWYFDPRVLGVAGRGELRLTWWVTIAGAASGTELESVFVDAADGQVVFAYSALHHARSRLVCDLAGKRVNLNDPAAYECSDAAGGPAIARREGGSASGVTDVNRAYDLLGATYDFYSSRFGRDSIDGFGMQLRATVRACDSFECPYQNAFWDGAQMVFGAGYANADDVVAHELTHGVTSYTSQLFYFAESGGINEALSDIMGELLDKSRGSDNDSQWLVGEDLPGGALRSMSNPPAFGDPDQVGSPQWAAALNDVGDNYGVHSLSGVVNKAAYLLADGGSQNGFGVVGIGTTKSAQIWYRLQHLLPSGAEMADLVTLLPFACRSVIGVAGITAADCMQASNATLATGMNLASGSGGGWTFADANDCGTAGMPSRTIFEEDFELGSNRWILDSPWQSLPSPTIPVSFANSGHRSLYVFEDDGNTQRPRAELDRWITAPSGSVANLRISWAENVLSSSGGLDVLVRPEGGSTISTGGGTLSTSKGYAKRVVSLNGLVTPGQRFTVILSADSSASVENELLIDDVRVYECLPGVTGQPQHLAAQTSGGGTSMTVTWSAPLYTAVGDAPAQYEVTVLPAPSGYTGPILVSAGTFSRTISGLDPAQRYQVAVRAIAASGTPGFGSITFVPSDGAFACDAPDPSSGHQRCSPVPALPPLTR